MYRHLVKEVKPQDFDFLYQSFVAAIYEESFRNNKKSINYNSSKQDEEGKLEEGSGESQLDDDKRFLGFVLEEHQMAEEAKRQFQKEYKEKTDPQAEIIPEPVPEVAAAEPEAEQETEEKKVAGKPLKIFTLFKQLIASMHAILDVFLLPEEVREQVIPHLKLKKLIERINKIAFLRALFVSIAQSRDMLSAVTNKAAVVAEVAEKGVKDVVKKVQKFVDEIGKDSKENSEVSKELAARRKAALLEATTQSPPLSPLLILVKVMLQGRESQKFLEPANLELQLKLSGVDALICKVANVYLNISCGSCDRIQGKLSEMSLNGTNLAKASEAVMANQKAEAVASNQKETTPLNYNTALTRIEWTTAEGKQQVGWGAAGGKWLGPRPSLAERMRISKAGFGDEYEGPAVKITRFDPTTLAAVIGGIGAPAQQSQAAPAEMEVARGELRESYRSEMRDEVRNSAREESVENTRSSDNLRNPSPNGGGRSR